MSGSAMNRGVRWNHSFPNPKSLPVAGRLFGCHRPRVSNRKAMNAIFFIPRTGARWNSLDAAGIRSCSSGVPSIQMSGAMPECSKEFWKRGLPAYDQMEGIDWSWIAMDGTMTEAPLAGSKKRVRIRPTGETEPVDRNEGNSLVSCR